MCVYQLTFGLQCKRESDSFSLNDSLFLPSLTLIPPAPILIARPRHKYRLLSKHAAKIIFLFPLTVKIITEIL